MFWIDIYPDIESGRKAKRTSWKCPERYIWYDFQEKRFFIHVKHKDKPWNAGEKDLIRAEDWVLI